MANPHALASSVVETPVIGNLSGGPVDGAVNQFGGLVVGVLELPLFVGSVASLAIVPSTASAASPARWIGGGGSVVWR